DRPARRRPRGASAHRRGGRGARGGARHPRHRGRSRLLPGRRGAAPDEGRL
ncbi:MAG: hypothetical protein AVDCRST_MAG13-3459, partial [uncultured Solirubrobacteraceae bacterium]